MNEKLLTLITPVYNKASYIQTWAECLAEQTYLNKMKILVVDNCSTDESLSLIENYSEKYNLPVEIIKNKENMGLMYSIRKAYHKIDTPFFCVLDADDYYISPQKIEKAVKFLQSHKDYSCYACNSYLEYPDGKKDANFLQPPEAPANLTFDRLLGTPFFQTASTTFVNYFTPELLDDIDRETEGQKKHAFQGDAFRNILAFHFGKIYFENSLDAVYRQDIGIWGTQSAVSHDLANMNSYFVYFQFLKRNFGIDNDCIACLMESHERYMKVLNTVEKLIDEFKNNDFDKSEETVEKILKNSGEINWNSVFENVRAQYKKFTDLKINFHRK